MEGGVSINDLGQVVFGGRTDRTEAVFTQAGLVAKEGDTLPDGTILDEIRDSGCVVINLSGKVALPESPKRPARWYFL